ncbi:FG-GAP repeat protein [Streptomyces sp. NPDC052610]|uniref:FG-GAP repeat protein n=1 Tax=Streptomyces sp. NPDC052610 TaxID=3154952 RepID=UPI00343485A8
MSGQTPAHRGGEIQVLYGGPEGITADQKPRIFHQDTAGVPGTGENADLFGATLSVGDTNGDKYADVLVGAPQEAVGSLASAGTATLLRGSATGLTAAKSVSYSQNTTGVPGSAERGDAFGAATHLADLDKDGRAETVVGAPGENSDGLVWQSRGTANGPSTNGSTTITGTAAGLKLPLLGNRLRHVLPQRPFHHLTAVRGRQREGRSRGLCSWDRPFTSSLSYRFSIDSHRGSIRGRGCPWAD